MVWDTQGLQVADARGHYARTNGEQLANARLIAAAPDLLAACEDALTACVDPYGPVDRTEAADTLRAAIAKAKGGTQ